MSFEEAVLPEVLRAVESAKLDAVVIGNAAAALYGVPISTQNIELFVQDTPRIADNIDQMVAALGGHVVASRPFDPASRMIRIEGLPVDVDLVFELSSHAKFESVRARSLVLTIEGISFRVATLQDVIDAKRAANRLKDQAVLPLLEQFQRVRDALDENL